MCPVRTGAWSQQFTFDGFGNLTYKNGSNAPTNAFLATNPATNRLTTGGAGYDNNGNLTSYGTGSFAAGYAYDIENRMTVSAAAGAATETLFGYDPSNQRVYQGTYNTSTASYSNEQIYFYGADGKKLVAYNLQVSGSNVTITSTQTKIWFAGRILAPQDRGQSQGKYFPYGEDRTNTTPANPANDQEKFATYTRDSATGLDYAYQRYYANQIGRFLTSDPYHSSSGIAEPQSFNRYSYSINDPANYYDPPGLFASNYDALGALLLSTAYGYPTATHPLPAGIDPTQANLQALLRKSLITTLRAHTAAALNALSSQCQTVLKNDVINLNQVKTIAQSTVCINAASADGNLTVKQASGYNSTETLAQDLGSARANNTTNRPRRRLEHRRDRHLVP